MSGYSSIFSAGLLATPRPEGHTRYVDYSTPSRPDSSINMDSDSDTTPTKLNAVPAPSSEDAMDFMPRSRASSNASATSPVPSGVNTPRLRRRRSSLCVANNGLSAVKSPQRSAGLALQRTALMSPGGRMRSGSTDIRPVNLPSTDGEGPGLVPSRIGGGRSRSGSMAGAMRPRRALRKPPPVPPPNVPLPPLPTSVAVTEVVHRRPLVHRARTSENFPPLNVTALSLDQTSSTYLAPALDFTNNLKAMAARGSPPSSSLLGELSAFRGSLARMNEN